MNPLIPLIKLSIDDSLFYAHAFSAVSKERKARDKENDPLEKVSAEEYDDLTRRLDKTEIQDSPAVRNISFVRCLVNLILDDKGELLALLLPRLTACVKKHMYSLGPDRQYDSVRQEQIYKVLELLQTDKEMLRLLRNIGKPYNNRYAEQVIKETLQLPENTVVTDAHARKAALAAWMCTLRQNVGSCFATAPAIILHDESPAQMFTDFAEMLGTGRLKRTFGGIEYSVPISSSWGSGDLKKVFALPTGASAASSEIWLSPGLLQAFEAMESVDVSLSFKERTEALKNMILQVSGSRDNSSPYVLTSADDLLKRVSMLNLELTEQDLIDYENRPKGMIQGGLLMQVPAANAGKGRACALFFAKLEVGRSAFKALADNALLKTWEFTLASFAETKADFTRWNLYSSLGFGPQEEHGIGKSIYDILVRKIEQANRKVQEIQEEYEIAYQQIIYLEARIRNASSDKEAQWIKAEYQAKRNEFNTLEEIRNKHHRKAERYSKLFDALINTYDSIFPRYFQEVYDADMRQVDQGPYDDSPAGFTLVYKFGRSNTSQWSRIRGPEEFIDALASFFTSTEREIASTLELEDMEQDLSEITTAVIMNIRTKEFLETAFYRMARAHNTKIVKDPLEHLDRIEKKPWSYTSGGSMGTLVSCYFKREQKPTEVERWVENPTELLVFLIDTVKQLPPKIAEEYAEMPDKSMLIHSPTHAFLLKPGMDTYKEFWKNQAFTYTWVRDQYIQPSENKIRYMDIEEPQYYTLIQLLAERIHPNYRPYFRQSFREYMWKMNPTELRKYIQETISKESGLRMNGRNVISEDAIDSFLFSALPLTPIGEMKEHVFAIVDLLPGIDSKLRAAMESVWGELPPLSRELPYVDAEKLRNAVKALICLATGETSTPVDYHRHVSEAARKAGLALPMPFVVADTNWVKDYFGFVVNPGTGQLEFWRVDCTGTVGHPMSGWEVWLNGSRHSPTWGIYNRPYEYTPFS